MVRQKIEESQRIIVFPTFLRKEQIEWLKVEAENTHFKVHKYLRDMIDKYRKLKEETNETTTQ